MHLISSIAVVALAPLAARAVISGQWSLTQDGDTGVSAQQIAVTSETTIIVLDKFEQNPLIAANGQPAMASEFNLVTRQTRVLNAASNVWCATGGFLSNGTFVNAGGNPVVGNSTNGLQAIRLFEPCEDGSCDLVEDSGVRQRMAAPRWYPGSVRLEDGSLLIMGGSVLNNFINNIDISNPTYEYYPPKNINGFNGLPIPSPFINDTLNANLFPFLTYLPDGRVLVLANTQAMILDWQNNTETRLPNIPNGVRMSYPYSGAAVLLPLTPENNYIPEVLVCGGSNVSDTVDGSLLSAQLPASSQCARLVLTEEGIEAGWSVEQMPEARTMNDMLLLPDGRVVIVNGAGTGMAGYDTVPDVIGSSNADHPTLTPVIYDPGAPEGCRFSSEGLPASNIPRMYHSTAILTPNGSVFVAGSNPNDDVCFEQYPTEYRVEFYDPPYLLESRPEYTGLPSTVDYNITFDLNITVPCGVDNDNLSVALMDLGFSTHGNHPDLRMVYLVSSLSDNGTTLTVTSPPSPKIYPPGPAFLFVVTGDGVPSFGHRTIIGTGEGPPVDEDAINNMLENTEPATPTFSPLHPAATCRTNHATGTSLYETVPTATTFTTVTPSALV